MLLKFLCTLAAFVSALAPLEQADGTGIHLGPWYDLVQGDTALAVSHRLNYKPFSFFHFDIQIGFNASWTYEHLSEFVSQVEMTNSSAFLYLTIYPALGFDTVTDEVVTELVQNIVPIVADGSKKMLIRYACEMNGVWFIYGQQPTAFIASWKKVTGAIKAAVPAGSVAFMWAPNIGSGYPFSASGSVIVGQNTTFGFDPILDTNKNGILDNGDDPYSPYYPGDEFVDWVAMSIYHDGNSFPYGANELPPANKLEQWLTGVGLAFNFYEMFSGSGAGGFPVSQSAGGKPFFLSETAAAIHLQILRGTTWTDVTEGTDPTTRMQIKQAWWRQYLNADFLSKYPKFKGACMFEFSKFEDSTFRDFVTLGKGVTYTISQYYPIVDPEALDGPTLAAFQQDMAGSLGKLVIWSNTVVPNITITTTSATPASTGMTGTPNSMTGSGSQQKSGASVVKSFSQIFFISLSMITNF